MTASSTTCPSCGARIEFRWAQAVQATCPFCKSVLLRHDLDWEKIGSVGEIPPDVSPIQLGTEGKYKNRSFVVVGRILYAYKRGRWNEWHLAFNDGVSGWLSDAQAEYAVTFAIEKDLGLPQEQRMKLGNKYTWVGTDFEVTTITQAHFDTVEGELPFKAWDKTSVKFVDLGNTTGKFATVDYSDDEPRLYVGEYVAYQDLQLKNVREFEGW